MKTGRKGPPRNRNLSPTLPLATRSILRLLFLSWTLVLSPALAAMTAVEGLISHGMLKFGSEGNHTFSVGRAPTPSSSSFLGLQRYSSQVHVRQEPSSPAFPQSVSHAELNFWQNDSLVACPSFALEFGIRPLLLPPMDHYLDFKVEKLTNELERQSKESQEAWKSMIESYKEQAAEMKDLSEEAYELYPKKAMVLFEDVSEQVKVQAKKARKYISLIAEQVTIEGREYLSSATENPPKPVKESARLFIGGYLSFMLIVSIPAIRFGMILGGAVLFIGGFLSFMLIVSIPAIRVKQFEGARCQANWEMLVEAVLSRERRGGADAFGQAVSGIVGNDPCSLARSADIDVILRAADEVQEVDPNVARILCEHAYSLAQNLDPDSEGRGVLQFKTGLMSVIKQKLGKREAGAIDRTQDIARLQEFYKLQGKIQNRLSKEVSPEDADKLIPEELKRVMKSDAAMSEDLNADNIVPLDSPSSTNMIVSFPEVKAAISALRYHSGLPKLPNTFSVPATRTADVLDFLQYVFGFQVGPDEILSSLEFYHLWCMDIVMMYGAHSTTRRLAVMRIVLRFLWFGVASAFVSYLYVKGLQNPKSVFYKTYIFVLIAYASVQLAFSLLMRIPACHRLTNRCDQWLVRRFIKWMHQERDYVGRGMYERTTDFIKYMIFWLPFLFSSFMQDLQYVDEGKTPSILFCAAVGGDSGLH
ncbi:callose synthase 9-like [Nymphaea colorata]|nr:callose synthase 9-like [Nymphaea colorata]